jgi:hypothetical protein
VSRQVFVHSVQFISAATFARLRRRFNAAFCCVISGSRRASAAIKWLLLFKLAGLQLMLFKQMNELNQIYGCSHEIDPSNGALLFGGDKILQQKKNHE